MLAIAILVGSCGGGSGSGGGISSSDFGALTRDVVTIVSDDPEKGARYGTAAGELAGLASDVTPAQELALGEALALRSFEQVGPRLQDEQMQRYVNLVAMGIAKQSSRPDLKFTTTILDSETPNAFAAPAGYLFITTGALKLMNSEAELAGVLGHEISHVTERHIIETLKRGRLFSAAASTVDAVKDEESKYSQRISAGQDILFNKGLDQRYEYEADRVGTELATLTGYDPKGLTDFLEKLAQANPGKAGILSTHPDTNRRVQELRQLTTTQLSGITGRRLQERFQENVTNRLK